MSGLVKRLRNFVEHNGSIKCVIEAAERIEQLERDLAREKWQFDRLQVEFIEKRDQLAAERSLADRLDELNTRAIMGVGWSKTDALELAEDYRKARGL